MNEYEWKRFQPMAFIMLMAGAMAGGHRGVDAASQAETAMNSFKDRFPIEPEPKEDE